MDKKEKIRKIFNIITVCILVALFAYTSYNLYKSYKSDDDIFFLGYKPIIMETDVMEPVIKKYDLVIVKKSNFKDIKEGSIVYFDSSEHTKSLEKITRKTPEGFRTKKEVMARESLQVLDENVFIGTALCLFKTSYIVENPIISGTVLLIVIALIILINKQGHRLKKLFIKKEDKYSDEELVKEENEGVNESDSR